MQIPKPLAAETSAKHGFTHEIKVLGTDLASMTTAATALVLTLANFLAGESVERIAWELITPFQDPADTGNNTSTVQLKLGSTSLISATEVNANGTTVTRARSDTLVTAATAQALTITFGAPASGKTLAALITGDIHICWQLSKPAALN